MKFFSKKIILIISLSTVLCGLGAFGIASAQDFAQANYNNERLAAGDNPRQVINDAGSGALSVAGTIANGVGGVLTGPAFKVIQTILFVLGIILQALIYILGLLFNFAMKFNTTYLHDIFSIGAINDIWTLVRDTLNVFFIFMLLYIAIQRIIGAWGVRAATTISNLVLSALFINFSMFIAKFIIDVGNVFAIAFYNQLASVSGGDISFNLVGGPELLNTFTHWSLTSQTADMVTALFRIAILGTIIYVLFWAILIFVGRVVMLIYLTATSPIAFVGNTLPRLRAEADEWWKNFVEQILVAPVFLFFLFIIFKVTEHVNDKGALGGIIKTNIGTNWDFDISTYFYFILLMMLLLKALEETKKLSGKVADTILDVSKKGIAGAAVALTGGTAIAAGGLGAAAGGVAAFAERRGFAGLAKGAGRVSGSLNKVGASTYKLTTGQFGERPGALGIASRVLGGGLSGGLKGIEGVTGGLISEKAIKAEQARIQGEDARREKELKDRKDSLLATDKMVSDRAQAAVEDELKQKREDLEKENRTDKNEYERSKRVEQEARGEIEVFKINNPGKPIPQDAQDRHDAAVSRFKKAESELDQSTTKLNKFMAKMQQKYLDVAKDLNVDVVKLQQDLLEATGGGPNAPKISIGPKIKESQVGRLRLGIQIQQNKYSPQSIWQAIRRGAVTEEEKAKVVKELYKNTEEEKEKK